MAEPSHSAAVPPSPFSPDHDLHYRQPQQQQHVGASSGSSSSGATPPNHLGTTVPTGHFDGNDKSMTHDPEKVGHEDGGAAEDVAEVREEGVLIDDDEIENIDALIDDLESHDGEVNEEEEVTEVGQARPIPEELLKTDTTRGLSDQEVAARRKKFGLNQLKEEKENLILKFLMYFVGPIQFVMEVRISPAPPWHEPRQASLHREHLGC